MITSIYPVLKQSLMITSFVFMMMVLIEYVNVQTRGIWQSKISSNKWKQYIFAAFLGSTPGCLGAFTAVALYSHRLISFGAIVATMIATSGDEAYVMFAMFPEKAALVTVIIFFVGILAGYISDKIPFFVNISNQFTENAFPLHGEEKCNCFPKNEIIKSLMKPSIYRLIISIIVFAILILLITGIIATGSEIWVKYTLILVFTFSLFVALTVPDHFLKEHLWDHIVKVHALRIFLWTFGTLLALHYLMNYIDINSIIENNRLIVLVFAVLVGIIPESGPHLLFVTLFAQGAIPFSILLASSASQDGHGMLPLLAESKKAFVAVKLVNVIFALLLGLVGYVFKF